MKRRLVFISISVFILFCITAKEDLAFNRGGYLSIDQRTHRDDKDSLVRLLDAKSAQLKEEDGVSYRIVSGPARFLHNDTYLLCDSAVWNVNDDVIDAIGNVQIIQEDTYLIGDKLTYRSNINLAEFRGEIVRLYNKKGDQLKTRFLDYNTKDSVAVFFNGGSMRSKDGQIIEGQTGRYESENKVFSFIGDVQIFNDSIFIRSVSAEYYSNEEKAYFHTAVTAWKERDTLFCNEADYWREGELLTLKKDNYIATENQEVWGDNIKYYRESGDAELSENVQIRDQSQSTVLLGDKGFYYRSPMRVILTQNPVVAMYSEEERTVKERDSLGIEHDKTEIFKDTLFAVGDSIIMHQLYMHQVSESEIIEAKSRLETAEIDPLKEINEENEKFLSAYYRNKSMMGKPVPPPSVAKKDVPNIEDESTDSLEVDNKGLDTLSIDIQKDSIDNVIPTDTLNVELDTTKVNFLRLFNNVKVYRSNLSGKCDSLIYTSLDSMARFYKEPVLLYDQKNQFTAEEISVTIKDNVIHRANLINNAMIIAEEDSIHFDQIKSVEMIAYFKDSELYRFDALGGVQAMLFFREREEEITLMNQKECKLMSAKIKDNEINRVKYIGEVKSDLIPTYNLPIDKQRLRGFAWEKDDLPKNRFELTQRVVNPSERGKLEKILFPEYPQTKIYFPDTYTEICNQRDSVNSKIARENKEREEKKREERIKKDKEQKLKKLREEDAFKSPSVILYTHDSLNLLIQKCQEILDATKIEGKILDSNIYIKGWEGFMIKELEYSSGEKLYFVTPSAEQLAHWIVSACWKSVRSLDSIYVNKVLAHIKNSGGANFPIRGILYDNYSDSTKYEPTLYKDGVVVFLDDAVSVTDFKDLEDSLLKQYTGKYAKIANVTREMYYNYGGKENVGMVAKIEELPQSEKYPLSFITVVREIYKKAFRSKDNELLDAWCYEMLR